MATSRPRITITLTERQYEVLRSIRDVGGQPMSQIVSDLLELFMPCFQNTADAYLHLKQVRDLQRDSIRKIFDDANLGGPF